jgi:hypothetical protein
MLALTALLICIYITLHRPCAVRAGCRNLTGSCRRPPGAFPGGLREPPGGFGCAPGPTAVKRVPRARQIFFGGRKGKKNSNRPPSSLLPRGPNSICCQESGGKSQTLGGPSGPLHPKNPPDRVGGDDFHRCPMGIGEAGGRLDPQTSAISGPILDKKKRLGTYGSEQLGPVRIRSNFVTFDNLWT